VTMEMDSNWSSRSISHERTV